MQLKLKNMYICFKFTFEGNCNIPLYTPYKEILRMRTQRSEDYGMSSTCKMQVQESRDCNGAPQPLPWCQEKKPHSFL